MRKLLLTAVALFASSTWAIAQNYTAQAQTIEDEEWNESYDGPVLFDEPVTVDVNGTEILIKGWLGSPDQDLRVVYDAETEEVLSVTPITKGVEGDTYKSGYAAFNTKSPSYYYVQLYLGEGYDYAGASDEGGYVLLSGYFYVNSSTYSWCYYDLDWTIEDGELQYTTKTHAVNFPDWDGEYSPFIPESDVVIDVYDNHITLLNWAGGDGYDLKIEYNIDGVVTALTPIIDGEKGETVTEGTLVTATGSPAYPTATIYLDGASFAYASDSEGYVLLLLDIDDSTAKKEYYYLPFDAEGVGVSGVAIDNHSPIEYYNLQGMCINNPMPGQIVIKRQGTNVSKQIIR